MIVREVLAEEKEQFNQAVSHPLQSWEWGEFREKMGIKTIRLGVFDGQQLKSGYQVTIHPLPRLPFTVLYFPKGPAPNRVMLAALKKLGQQEKAILIKLEPNVGKFEKLKQFLLTQGCREGQPLFTGFTFLLDLNKSEEQLLAEMKPKTRYNIRLAQKHQVEVVEDNSQAAFGAYLKLMQETIKRQGFYAHTPAYHRLLSETLIPQGMYHLFLAKYKGEVLAAYVFFTFKDVLYYPYGASSRVHREVMPTYALFWEAIKFGKKMGCRSFDMWGTPGPNPDPKDPWFGFHRFKEGFGAKLFEFVGTYDLVVDPRLYPLYNFANTLRWKILRFKSRLGLKFGEAGF